MEAVKVIHSAEMVDTGLVGATITPTSNADEDAKYHPVWRKQKVYICPRGINVHRGNQDSCGQACRKARELSGGGYLYEDEDVLKSMLVIRRKTVVDHGMCVEGR